MYSQYIFNPLAINPAYAGSRDIVSAAALFRSQLRGLEGAPVTTTMSFDMPMRNKKQGFSMQAFNDQIGVTYLSGGFVSYAYRIFMEKSTIAFGLQAGATHFKANFSSATSNNSIPAQPQNINQTFLNIGAGIYFNTDRFYFGISIPHLLKNNFNSNSGIVSNGLDARQYLQSFIVSGYIFSLGEDFKIEPSVLFKGIQGAPIQFDLNTNLWIKDVFSVGVQYHTNASIAPIAKFKINPQIRMGYSYDRSRSKFENFNTGSHEFMLSYEFDFQKEKVSSPRNF